MFKKILIYSMAVIAVGYIVFALLFLTKEEEGALCKGLKISITDGGSGALTDEKIASLLAAKGISPVNKPIENADCQAIEAVIGKLSVVEECQAYKTHRGYIGIDIDCKIPIMQVFDINGREFHIDNKGAVIDGISNAMYLPVANGFITTEMARKELLTIARFLQENRFWNEQIEQIFFTAKKEVLLVPRIGNHTIELGCVNNLEKKLDKLRKFYQKGLNTVGWNKYKKINIEFDKQVICTKRDK